MCCAVSDDIAMIPHLFSHGSATYHNYLYGTWPHQCVHIARIDSEKQRIRYSSFANLPAGLFSHPFAG